MKGWNRTWNTWKWVKIPGCKIDVEVFWPNTGIWPSREWTNRNADLTNRWYTGKSVVTNGKTSARQERVKVEEQQYLQMQVPWDGRMHWFVGLLTLNLEEIIDLTKISEIFQRLRNEFVARTTGGREQKLCKLRRAGFHCQVWVGSGCLVWHLVTTAVTVVVVYTQTIPCVNSTPHGYFRKWGYPQINPNHPFSQDFTIIISHILL